MEQQIGDNLAFGSFSSDEIACYIVDEIKFLLASTSLLCGHIINNRLG